MRDHQASLSQLKDYTEEILGLDTLESALEANFPLKHYLGCEISGLVHLGTGLVSGIVLKYLQEMGVETSYYLADWHTWINNKLGGDREFITKVSQEYFGEALKISAKIAGADDSKVALVEGSELYHNNDRYWQGMVEISKNLTLSRVLKSTTIMGRQESESMPFAYMMYPPMQAADIFEMGCHIAHAGMDQRKVHVIAREVAEKLTISPLKNKDGSLMKPICIHQRLLLGLQKPAVWPLPEGDEKTTIRTQMKMSKSVPGSAIFIHDSEEEIRSKIKNAFCPEKETEYNPVLQWMHYLLFPILGEIKITREDQHGGSFTAKTFEDLKEQYASGALHPVDLKNNVADMFVEILKPARDHFSNKKELIEEIRARQSR